MKYRPEIDGLRAIAVAPVILFHAGFEMFSGGFVGVDIFFVISGYLITNIIIEDIYKDRFSLRNFYERRARRILPALIFVCIFCLPFAYLWMLPGELRDFSQSIVAVSLFSSNFLFWKESGYFESASELKPLLHTWSLAIEEQFYIIFPLFFLIIGKWRQKSTIAILLVVIVISILIAEFLSRFYPSANFFLLPSRAWELGFGAVLAFVLGGNQFGNARVRNIGSALGFLLIALAIFIFDETTRFPSLWTMIPVVGTGLLIACSGNGDWVGRAMSLKPIVGLGLISFSAYLWHQPIFAFARIRMIGEPSTISYICLIVLALSLAFFSWKFVEMPFRDNRQIAVPALIRWVSPSIFLLVFIGTVGHATSGFRPLFQEAYVNLEQRLDNNLGLSNQCEGEFTLSSKCRTSENPEIVVWGDSYAMHLVDGLVASRPEVNLIQHTKSVCGPILGIAPVSSRYPVSWAKKCIKFNDRVLSYIELSNSIKYVILASPFRRYVNDRAEILYTDRIIYNNSDFIAKKIQETVEKLEALGITTVVVAPPPSDGTDKGRCLLNAHRFNFDFSVCDVEVNKYFEIQSNVISLFDILKNKGVNTFSFDNVLCRSDYCITGIKDVFIYRDAGHFSKEGSRYLGEAHDFFRLFFAIDRASKLN